MGEFSAGKSTLSNMLLGDAPFPVKVTATRLPPVWASYGENAAIAVGRDGEETPFDISDMSNVSLAGTAYIRLHRKADILQLCDLIDMPGVSDPNMPAESWMPLVEEIDFVIWCTHATQAWRQSEAAIWERLVEHTNGENILLITQIDKIRNERDRGRISSRVRKETGDLFKATFPVSLLQAINAGDDFELSQEKGTAEFVEHLIDVLLKPSTPSPRTTISWETAPELPRAQAGLERRVAPVTAASEGIMPDDEEDDGQVMPKRVRKPEHFRTRPVRPARSEVAHG